MEPIDSLKHLALPGMLLVHAAMAFILLRGVVTTKDSMSVHVAAGRPTFLLFAVVQTIYSLLIVPFMMGWFAPKFQLPPIFLVVVLTAVALHMGSAWTLEGEGRKGLPHKIFAYSMATLMLPIVAFLLFSPVIAFGPKLAVGGVLAIMVTLAVLGLLKVAHTMRNYLWYQLSYIALYCVAILIVTYTV